MLIRLIYITVWLMLFNPFIVFFFTCGFLQYKVGAIALTWLLPFVVVASFLVWNEIWNAVRLKFSDIDDECLRRMGWNKRYY